MCIHLSLEVASPSWMLSEEKLIFDKHILFSFASRESYLDVVVLPYKTVVVSCSLEVASPPWMLPEEVLMNLATTNALLELDRNVQGGCKSRKHHAISKRILPFYMY